MSEGHGRLLALQQCLFCVYVQYISLQAASCGWLCAHCWDLPVCKAVSVDIASMEERFLHSLCYTLINLLKPARPVSSTLTHQKNQAVLNPTRIYSLDVSGKSLQPHRWQLSVSVQKCIKQRQTYTLLISHGGYWVGWQIAQRFHEAPGTVRMLVYIAFQHPHSIADTSRANTWSNLWSVAFF